MKTLLKKTLFTIGTIFSCVIILLSIRYLVIYIADGNEDKYLLKIDWGMRGTGTINYEFTDLDEVKESLKLFEEINKDELSDFDVELFFDKYEVLNYSFKPRLKFFQLRRSMRNEAVWYIDSLKLWLLMLDSVKEKE